MVDHVTVVFADLTQEELSVIMRPDGKWCAISRSHALDEKEMLESFVRRLANGEIDHASDEAQDLMIDMGWA